MAFSLEILKFPDARLRNKGKAVDKVTADLALLAQNMLDLMYQESGVGLSSIQVNQPIRLFTADTRLYQTNSDRYSVENMGELEQKIKQPLICFNPEITSRQGEVVFKEGCLSFPSYYADVKRSAVVEFKALDVEGRPFSIKTDGLLSICVQHEIDHLDGRLFIDHLSPVQAQKLREQIKTRGYPSKKTAVDRPGSSNKVRPF